MIFHDTSANNRFKALMLVVFFICATVIATVLGVGLYFCGISMLTVTGLTTIVTFGLPVFLYYLYFLPKRPMGEIKWRNISLKPCFAEIKWLFIAVLWLIVSAPAINCFSEQTQYDNAVLRMVTDTSYCGLLYLIFIMGVLPAIFEELFFRGILQRLLVEWTERVWLGILITSVVFSLMHFDIDNFIARTLLGILLGLLYQYSGTIWANITFHFCNNTVAAISLWFIVRNPESDITDSLPWYINLISAVLIITAVVYNEIKNPKSLKNNYIH